MSRVPPLWWVDPRRLCAAAVVPANGAPMAAILAAEASVDRLLESGVALIVSTAARRDGLSSCERRGAGWHHVCAPCADLADSALDELLPVLRRAARGRRPVALIGEIDGDFLAAAGAAYLHVATGVHPLDGLVRARRAGLPVTEATARLVGVDYEAVRPRSRIVAATSSGRSVTT